jgi:hypothetical protein
MATGMEQASTLEMLKELGMDKAAEKVVTSRELVRKTAVAYEHYEFITTEDVAKFNEKLRSRTVKDETGYTTYDTLKFIPLKEYREVPPKSVLEALKTAKGRSCFDSFEIAKIESVKEVKDPILFGLIDDCKDLFYIAQWDDDVTIEAIKEASGK